MGCFFIGIGVGFAVCLLAVVIVFRTAETDWKKRGINNQDWLWD